MPAMNTPNDLPSVGTALPEPSFRLVWLSDRAVYKVNKPNIDTTDCYTPDVVRALVSERDELASRVRELEVGRDAALHLIGDDAYAMSFQTMGQYRSAILVRIATGPKP
jgi:hypothetical protein